MVARGAVRVLSCSLREALHFFKYGQQQQTLVNKITMENIKPLFLSALLILFFASTAPKTERVKWISLAEAEASLKKETRPVLIDLYTDWCGWCKVMDKKTYTNKGVINYLQNKFYTVRVNAETREKLVWQEKSYNYDPSYKTNEFAVYMTHGRLAFPTTIIIPADGSGPQAIPGYLETKDMELILKYFAEGSYNKVPFDEYQKNFKHSW
ncbi:MAG: thioredoxin family protein [Bacteroidetes bacterium]|nr:thioredoxin family protein [Bacteroidota bacterium]MBS1975689.1 thioredoxin family protein [Bacteroidota bacterium]